MPCDYVRPDQTKAERKKEVDTALKKLERALAMGSVTVKVGPTGSVAFRGEWARNGITDLCAYRKLMASGSAAMRLALSRAEGLAGRQVDKQAVASGVHSHDNGETWHGGHDGNDPDEE